MTTVKRITDLTEYTSVLPYASEMFGIYQPLLGWRSQRIKERFEEGFKNDKAFLLDKLRREFAPIIDIKYRENDQVGIEIRPGILKGAKFHSFDSVVLKQVAALLPDYENYHTDVWNRIVTEQQLDIILKKDVVEFYSRAYEEMRRIDLAGRLMGIYTRTGAANRPDNSNAIEIAAFEHQLQYESSVAGSLLFLVKEKSYPVLEEIFYASKDDVERARTLMKALAAEDSTEAYLNINNLNPTDQEQMKNVVLSPIAIVHLFRQYFFELDTFLGTPESHVWLSPGSTVELLEIHTRKTITERTLETTLDILTKSEKTITEQEEISEAVKEENGQDIKFGASVTASYASIDATSSFDYNSSQKLARETTHKRMRQQTEKLSSEIRRNFKSTFKTITELTDISSTKHILANNTNSLINYELRRKMRQVGVQVQDIGSYLCWQTYVDDPGRDLGLSTLIHIAKSPDLDAIPHPQEIPTLQTFQEEKIIAIPFISIEGTGADKEGEVYVDGKEENDEEWHGNLEKIQADFKQEFVCPRADYILTNVEFDTQGKPVIVSRRGEINNNASSVASFILHLDRADFQGQDNIPLKLILHWSPKKEANDAIAQQNKENLEKYNAQEKAAFEKAYIETVKDRVTTASKITTRKNEELREEERIVVYRKLIQEMLLKGVSLPDDRTRHVVAELINSIFDVEKMLYFVAPEWWRPRLHRSKQQLQQTPERKFEPITEGIVADGLIKNGLMKKIKNAVLNAEPNIVSSSKVGWGGINDIIRDNYYITDESEPAKLGSSLGWLMQLDGDNMRNAFLNAPWVKAVIPIRPGKEEAAINWLKGVEGMNGITDDVIYHASSPEEKDINGNPLEGQKMLDVLVDLAMKIKKKHEQGVKTGKYPKTDEVTDPTLVDEENTVTSTPIDRVYEHGFFPLEGSFRANVSKNYEIFDQWTEILPTDQIVPVEVAYDPKTGRQVPHTDE
ncbi:MAG: hypothetical protein ACPK85_15620 [Methanosarcina sp.]